MANDTKVKLWKNKLVMALGTTNDQDMQFEDMLRVACDQIE